MPELIDRHALKNHLCRAQAEAFKRSEWYAAGSIQSFIDLLDKQPTIEPEVRHGRWVMNNPYGIKCCSECGYGQSIGAENYCPNCGADMREGGVDNG